MGLDPAVWEEWGKKLNLDKPVPIQFALWMGDILTGDFGDSVTLQRPVLTAIREYAPSTIQLGIVAWLMGTVVGVPLGVFSATNRGKFLDYIFRGFALFGQSVPIFWLALVLIFVFAGEPRMVAERDQRRGDRDQAFHHACGGAGVVPGRLLISGSLALRC